MTVSIIQILPLINNISTDNIYERMKRPHSNRRWFKILRLDVVLYLHLEYVNYNYKISTSSLIHKLFDLVNIYSQMFSPNRLTRCCIETFLKTNLKFAFHNLSNICINLCIKYLFPLDNEHTSWFTN